MRRGLSTAVPLVLLMASGCASKSPFDLEDVASPYAYQYTWEQGRIYHNPTGREMTREQLYDYLAGFTVIYVGESHDSVDDHAVQLEILQALHERFPGEVALGLEMLRTDSQAAVDRWVSGAMSDKEMVRLWARNWGAASYPYYKDILAYVREVGMPVVALNRPRYLAPPQQGPGASTDGAVGTSVRPRPDPEIDNDDPYYQAYIGAFLAGHDAGPGTLEQFIRAQSLWDETMAESAATFLSQADNRSRRLVVRRPVVYVETREKRSARFPRPPRAEDFAIGRLADDLVAVCRRLGLDDGRTALFGSSMGSNAILEALKHGRLRARSAFVVGPNATFTPPWWGRGLVALPVAAYGLIREPLIWYLRRFRVNAREDPEQMRRYERTLRSADPLRLKLSARAVAGYDARPGLETIAVPVAVAYAEADTLHDAEPIRQLAERIPVGETMTFASSTAMHREEVVEPLERFIDRC